MSRARGTRKGGKGVGSIGMLDGCQYRPLDRCWQFKSREPRSRKQVVFAGFVDHPNLSVASRYLVWKNLVDLPEFERHFIPFVSNTDRKVATLFCHGS